MRPLTCLAIEKLVTKLSSSTSGVACWLPSIASASAIENSSLVEPAVIATSATAEMLDRNLQAQYPRVTICATGLQNSQVERFRSFSGTVALAVEVVTSSDRLTDLHWRLNCYVEATTSVLNSSIGDWGDGFFFGGEYEVQFLTPKAGGAGFVQSAKAVLSLNASRD